MGHTISFYVTAALMFLVGGVLAQDAIWGARSHAPTFKRRYGPVSVMAVAATLIMVEPVRHVINDMDIWPWCGNNPVYDRINSTDPFPPQCYASATQYHCTQVCCVSTWQPISPPGLPSNSSGFSWWPPSSDFFPAGPLPGPFATLRDDGSIYTPPGTSAAGPYALYRASVDGAPLTFYETGEVNPLRRTTPATGCLYGVNTATGYCFLTNQSLSYEQQLEQLPLADVTLPFNATSNPHTCGCDGCSTEDFAHLSTVGVITTILCTYTGFAMLTIAVGWNANILAKLSKVKRQWKQLRGQQAEVSIINKPLD